VKVLNPAVLSCLDDMFYRLPFPTQNELEKLIKDAQGETAMIEFRAALKEDLHHPRALKDFESGWEKYWAETRSQKRAAVQPAKSMKDRLRSESPPNSSDGDGADLGNGETGPGSSPSRQVQ
jgi:hypothetical protein